MKKLRRASGSRIKHEDIVRSTLSELVLFLVFFFLILLGAKSEMRWSEELPSDQQKPTVYWEEPRLGFLSAGTADPVCLPSFMCSTSQAQSDPLRASSLPDPPPIVDFTRELPHKRESAELGESLLACYFQLSKCSAPRQWPPFFELSEAEGYSFASGSDELSVSFRNKLRYKIIPLIFKTILDQEYEISLIEIIGHTDEQPVASGVSNLDANLTLQLGSDSNAQPLLASDNAGLGLARAIAVRREIILEGTLRDFPIIVLSAGQGIETSGDIAIGAAENVDDAMRRRIEIRLRGKAQRIK